MRNTGVVKREISKYESVEVAIYRDENDTIVDEKIIARFYDTNKAVKDAIADRNIIELDRLYRITNQRDVKKKIFLALVELHEGVV